MGDNDPAWCIDFKDLMVTFKGHESKSTPATSTLSSYVTLISLISRSVTSKTNLEIGRVLFDLMRLLNVALALPRSVLSSLTLGAT